MPARDVFEETEITAEPFDRDPRVVLLTISNKVTLVLDPENAMTLASELKAAALDAGFTNAMEYLSGGDDA